MNNLNYQTVCAEYTDVEQYTLKQTVMGSYLLRNMCFDLSMYRVMRKLSANDDFLSTKNVT